MNAGEMIALRALALFLLLTVVPAHGRETIRQGVPKPCYIFNVGKGPRWMAQVPVEFREEHLQKEQPFVSDSFFEPTPDALVWHKKSLEPEIEVVGRAAGRKMLKIEYRYTELHTLSNICVLLVMETEEGSGWYAPFYAICSERFAGQFVSGKDVAFGYVATLNFSGTGAERMHHLFDLKGEHPKLVRTVDRGRTWRPDFDSDADFEKALKRPDEEEAIFRGELAAEAPAGK